jgi:general secretion pathway protein G
MLVSSITMSLGLIIFLLTAVVMPRLADKASLARVNAAQTDLHVLAGAVRNFRLDNDRYPTEDEGLQALVIQPIDCPGWRGPYVEGSIPSDPWRHAYVYDPPAPGGGGSFSVESYGKDGSPGGTGEAADLIVKDE